MPRHLVQPNGWAAIRLLNESLKVLQVTPNTTISLGKYGSFPSNLILERPFHLTYEIQEKEPDESFSRLRVVPATEANADALADTTEKENAPDDNDDVIATAEGEELELVDETGKVVVRSSRELLDESARQTLTSDEIEELKQRGAAAGKEIITKLLLSHTALSEKTSYSLAKYKLLKTKKYMRRFTVLPLDVPLLLQWLLDERDASKILEIRPELMGLMGCWADVHFAPPPPEDAKSPLSGRWLCIDDTGGLVVAALAERMGILYPKQENVPEESTTLGTAQPIDGTDGSTNAAGAHAQQSRRNKRPHRDDFEVLYNTTNTLTILHSHSQASLPLLKYFSFDAAEPNPPPPYHPLFTNLLSISWLQLLHPEQDPLYAEEPPSEPPEVVAGWKANRRGNYHRKRKRWAKTHHIVDDTRGGGFSGFATATTMEPISVLQHVLPLLAGGAPIAIYSQSIEPLTALVDCFSVGRRAAWVTNPPPEFDSTTPQQWTGNDEFPLNPTLVLSANIQSSRAKRWQVLPGRTHPFMMGKGGAEGYLFTGWKAVPVEGRIEARGKFRRKKIENGKSEVGTPGSGVA